MVRLADQSFVLSLHHPATNLHHSHHGSDTNFSTCAVSGRQPTTKIIIIICCFEGLRSLDVDNRMVVLSLQHGKCCNSVYF